jgi:drug/metabolite transporter (DMT)-like permease
MVRVLPATLFGTYLAMLLMMAGIALAPATVAAVLLATTPVFSLLLESWVERRLPTATGILGTLLAIAGVAILTRAS